MASIRIRNQQKRVRIAIGRLSKLARRVLRKEGRGSFDLDVLITGNAQIARYHQKYLRTREATDVIAFGMQEGRKVAAATGRRQLGDVVLSAETAKRVARELKIPVQQEVERYLVHGILHLTGYRDHNPRAARRMHKRQEEYLSSFDVKEE
jgi:probable rRNA maturation factor